MDAAALLQEVTSYCRRAGLAETTFGRLAVNDGKFINRLRGGGRATPETLESGARLYGAVAASAGRGRRLRVGPGAGGGTRTGPELPFL